MSIEIRHMSFSYDQHLVLNNINIEIPDATLVNVLGHNGAGKSTLFRCILGLNSNYEGEILVNGRDMRSLSVKERAREISYIPQSHAPVYDYEVLDIVLMSTGTDLGMMRSPGPRHRKRAFEALERVGIDHLAHREYTQISGGEQQLVLIARALAQNARTIIMDEPTSALDYGNTVRVLSCVHQLAREGLSILQSTHQPDQAFLYSDKTLVLNNNQVEAFGDPRDVITKELVSSVYGIDVEVNSLYDDRVRVCIPVQEIKDLKEDTL